MIDYVRIRDKELRSREGTNCSRLDISYSNGLKIIKLNKQ